MPMAASSRCFERELTFFRLIRDGQRSLLQLRAHRRHALRSGHGRGSAPAFPQKPPHPRASDPASTALAAAKKLKEAGQPIPALDKTLPKLEAMLRETDGNPVGD